MTESKLPPRPLNPRTSLAFAGLEAQALMLIGGEVSHGS